ncbi:hypothetical protein [Variovorax sp. GT1P44]|uniref:hypothetical protein n=1 Tax=Variovorax sp. GT1P44 TaxID=3443742 RepID=UPI003F46B8C9
MSHTLSVSGAAAPVFPGKPALEPVRLSGREGVNRLLEYEPLLKTPLALNLGDPFRRQISAIRFDASKRFIHGVGGAGGPISTSGCTSRQP